MYEGDDADEFVALVDVPSRAAEKSVQEFSVSSVMLVTTDRVD